MPDATRPGYEKMIEMKVSFDTDRQRAMADTKHWAALALSPEEKTHVEDPREMERLADALPVERTASRWIVSDDPEEQVDRIRPYVELGFRHLVFHAPGPDQAALPAALWRARAPEIAAGLRLRGMSRIASLELLALPGMPIVRPGDDLPALIGDALDRAWRSRRDDDVLVIAQKIVSKAEGRYVVLADVEPSPEAVALGAEIGKDARLVQVILSESVRVVRKRANLLIMQHRLGFVMANAGVDHSNVESDSAAERVLLLPRDPDASAAAIRARLGARFGIAPSVIMNDSFGRPWRRGVTGVAIGAAGLPSLVDHARQARPCPAVRCK